MNLNTLLSPLHKYANAMPQGTVALHVMQMFATLSFAVLYSTLVLYATNALHLSDTLATCITASFVAFNFTLHLFSGYIGGRFFSFRVLFAFGMLSTTIGCLLLAIPEPQYLYWGLTLFLLGSGFNITCINCMLTQLFQPEDKRRETAFLFNYSGLNIGAFTGFLISGYFQLHNAYDTLFVLSAVGNLIALILTVVKWRYLRDIHSTLSELPQHKRAKHHLIGGILIVVMIPFLHWFLLHASFTNTLITGVGLGTGIVLAMLAKAQPKQEDTNKIFAFLIFSFTALVFWTLYLLAPMSLTLFIERNVDRHMLGLQIPPQWVQNINTVVIIAGGPLLSMLFIKLRRNGVHFPISWQFAFSLLVTGVGFVALSVGIYFANSQGYVSFIWVFLCFVLQSLGELFIAPVGFAMVGQLAPKRLQGIMIGAWSMISGVAATVSSYFSKLSLGEGAVTNPLLTNGNFSHTFTFMGLSAIAIGTTLFFAAPVITRLTSEKNVRSSNLAENPI